MYIIGRTCSITTGLRIGRKAHVGLRSVGIGYCVDAQVDSELTEGAPTSFFVKKSRLRAGWSPRRAFTSTTPTSVLLKQISTHSKKQVYC
jgi:hypothetical protein